MYCSVQNATHLQKCAAALPVDYWIPADVALPALNPESRRSRVKKRKKHQYFASREIPQTVTLALFAVG
jgi:hypothetical protein